MKAKARHLPDFELADVLNARKEDLASIVNNSWKCRTLYALSRCRTAAMGGHIDRCSDPECGKLHLSYNSCRNRHCPKCQGHLREQWMAAREKELVNCSYFHVVFTLPHHLNEWALSEPKLIYGLLFKTAWGVIRDFAANPEFMGAKSGMCAVLHTWGQNLSLHPHLHCIVPAGGLSPSGRWKASKSKGRFLFPVKEMGRVFRARFVAALRKSALVSATLSDKLFAKPWVVYCKQPFFGARQVVEYLGRYTHKIAISNHRIVSMANGCVTFKAKDYRDKGKSVLVQLDECETIRRFALHILPKGFTRIRHYGLLSSTSKVAAKLVIDAQLGAVAVPERTSPIPHRLCPVCKKGTLQTIALFDGRGPPKHWLYLLRSSSKKQRLWT